MGKIDDFAEKSANVVDDCRDRAGKPNRCEVFPSMSDEEFGKLVYETPQPAMELLLNRAKECGVIDMAPVRAWGIKALASAPGEINLPLLSLVLDRLLGLTVEHGQLVFHLDERNPSKPH